MKVISDYKWANALTDEEQDAVLRECEMRASGRAAGSAMRISVISLAISLAALLLTLLTR